MEFIQEALVDLSDRSVNCVRTVLGKLKSVYATDTDTASAAGAAGAAAGTAVTAAAATAAVAGATTTNDFLSHHIVLYAVHCFIVCTIVA